MGRDDATAGRWERGEAGVKRTGAHWQGPVGVMVRVVVDGGRQAEF